MTIHEVAGREYRDILSQRLRELSFLNKGVKIVITDEREEDKAHVFKYDGGIASFVEHLAKNKSPLHPEPVYFNETRDEVEVATSTSSLVSLK